LILQEKQGICRSSTAEKNQNEGNISKGEYDKNG
jgi:hypothetical protein